MNKNTVGIIKNYIYQMVYEILIIILPIVTSPYIARVIGAEGLGIYSYSYSVAYYFVLFSMLGLKNYGNRAIAQSRDKQIELNTVFSNILAIHLLVSSICSLVYTLYALTMVSKEGRLYALIQCGFVFSALFDISWFFFGIERFKMTVIRNVVIKLASVACIFLFVHKKNDLWKYCVIMSLSNLISQLVLWIPLRRYVHIVKPTRAHMLPHIKPLFLLFIPAIAVSLYKYMDKIMLGSASTKIELGYYENAEKIILVPLSVIEAFGTVMLPKMSNVIHNKQMNLANKFMDVSMRYVMCLAVALSSGLAAVGQVFAPVFWGNEFNPSGIIIVGLSVTIPFISFANVIRTQYLIPTERDREYLLSVIAGAVVNLIMNSLLIKKMGAWGATIGTIAAEVTVCLIQAIAVKKEIKTTKFLKDTIPFILFGTAMFVVVWEIGKHRDASVLTLVIQIMTGILIYGMGTLAYMYLIKDSLLISVVKKIKRKRQ